MLSRQSRYDRGRTMTLSSKRLLKRNRPREGEQLLERTGHRSDQAAQH